MVTECSSKKWNCFGMLFFVRPFFSCIYALTFFMELFVCTLHETVKTISDSKLFDVTVNRESNLKYTLLMLSCY